MSSSLLAHAAETGAAPPATSAAVLASVAASSPQITHGQRSGRESSGASQRDKDRQIIRCLCFCKIKVLKPRQVYIGKELMV